MSSNSTKTREEILAERQEKKKKKAALKNQPKEKNQNKTKENEAKTLKNSPVTGSFTASNEKEETKLKSKPQSASEILFTGLEKQNKVNCTQKKEIFESSGEINKSKKLEETGNLSLTAGSKVNSKVEALDNADKNTVKTKAQLKAERRAKQEAERAKKLEKVTALNVEKSSKPPPKPKEPVKVASISPAVPQLSHKVKLFAHLYKAEPAEDVIDGPVKIHPSIIQLGAQYSSKVVSGANACCLALLNAFKKVVMDFEIPPSQDFSRGLEAEITKCMSYLSRCRPAAVSMVNAVKHLKFQVSQCKGNDLECKNNISEWIDTYIKEQLEMAAKAICLFVREKIAPGDVILTYGCSSLIQQILISVHNEGINFQVIVVDGRPWLEGREMLRRLVSAGIQCKYVFVNGLSFIMPEVTKILLGAHALLANGYVMSRAGSSQIALLAKTYNVPVLVCCETHKFSERVQTDSFVHNELGNPDDLASKKGCLSKELSRWKTVQYLTPLNLTYDVTPPDLVSAVVTEIAVLPCTSVPVILRIKPPEVCC